MAFDKILKQEVNNTAFSWKNPSENFNISTQLIGLGPGNFSQANCYFEQILCVEVNNSSNVEKCLLQLILNGEARLSKTFNAFMSQLKFQLLVLLSDIDFQALLSGKSHEQQTKYKKASSNSEQLLETGHCWQSLTVSIASGANQDISAGFKTISSENMKFTKSATGHEQTQFGPYSWLVLKKEDDKVLLISKNCVVKGPICDSQDDVTWEDCSLRQWLNGEFLKGFTEEQLALILDTNVETTDNVQYKLKGGNTTVDKVFLLSDDMAFVYFWSDASRVAKFNGMPSRWWLRSPGGRDNYSNVFYMKDVDTGGAIRGGSPVGSDDVGVRPVLWLNLKSGVKYSAVQHDTSFPPQADAYLLTERAEKEQERRRLEAQRQEELVRKLQRDRWVKQGLCRYCGGKMSILGRKCKVCGKQN